MQGKIEFLFETPEVSPGYLLNQLHLIWQRKVKNVLDPLNLTHTQFVLLASIAWLTNKRSDITQVELAALNNYDRMMVSKVLRTLQSKNLIERREHSTDTRAKVVTLTSSGKKLLQTALTKVEKMDIDFFETLGNNIDNFNSNLQTLIETNRVQ